MGIMSAWQKMSQNLYDKFGSKLQAEYDFWKNFDDPDLRAACQALWTIVPATIQKSMSGMLLDVVNKYGEDFAKKLVAQLNALFNKGVSKN